MSEMGPEPVPDIDEPLPPADPVEAEADPVTAPLSGARTEPPPTEQAEAIDEGAADAADLSPAEVRAAVEALLFVSTKPVGAPRLAQCLIGASPAYLDGLLLGLSERYTRENRGWELRRIANGWQLFTRKELYPWVRQLDKKEPVTALSRSALETLAVVAYRQPVTRGVIEDIRGVQVGPVLRQLLDLRLVQAVRRDEDALGRPWLYETTDAFLMRFGLGSLADLPKRHEFGA